MTSSEWGRVADDGTVYVKTADGERPVGSYPAGTPGEAMAFFTERFTALEFEVQLLEQRVNAAKLSPEEATTTVRSVRTQVAEANAVGDLASLAGRLDALAPIIATQREARRQAKAQQAEETKAAKEALVAMSEKIAEGKDWRNGANRLRELLDQWKALPRLDKAADDELWKRFSSARSTYTRHRKAHFAEQDEKRAGAAVVKERLCKEAEALSSSTEWGPTAGKYRELMRQWKDAGPAPRGVDDELWKRFRGAQDAFFGARDAANAELDKEFAANAEVKEQILVEAEALLPITDLDAAKKAMRGIGERWEAAGKVPRDRIKELEARIRAVENAIRTAEDNVWKRSDPEKSARADGMVAQLEAAIAKAEDGLAKAKAAGDEKKIAEFESELTSRRQFLDMAQKVSSEYQG